MALEHLVAFLMEDLFLYFGTKSGISFLFLISMSLLIFYFYGGKILAGIKIILGKLGF